MSDRARIRERETVWRQVDEFLGRGELDAELAIQTLGEAGLVRRANAFPMGHAGWTLYVLEPERTELVAGPRLLLQMGGLYGGPRMYRPQRALLLPDTGAYQTPLAARALDDSEAEG